MKQLIIFWIFLGLPTELDAQVISDFAGNGCTGIDSGYNIPATSACIGYTGAGSFDGAGNYYFSEDGGAIKVEKIDVHGIITTVAGNGTSGYSGDGIPATDASLVWGYAIVDSAGNIYIPDNNYYRVFKVDASTGIIKTIAGNGIADHSGDGGPATAASLWSESVCVDKFGNVYVTDSSTWIRKIAPSGLIYTVAGNGIQGFSGDGGPATAAELNNTYALCADSIGNIFIGSGDGRIRKIDIATDIITTIAGNGTRAPYVGEGLPATDAQIYPFAIAMDKMGSIYIADYGVGNDRVLKIGIDGIVHTIAGTGVEGYSGDGGAATNAQIFNPEGVAIDACGNVYIADDENRRIRKVTFDTSCNLATLSIKKSPENPTFTLYPNPAHDAITITAQATITHITISNLLGQAYPVPCPYLNTGEVRVDVAGLPAGVYVVRITDSEGREAIRLLMIND